MPGIIGPIKEYTLEDGTQAPLYILKFDKHGNCITPRTQDRFVAAIAQGTHTDVYVFSHGWNNTPKHAIEKYKEWIEGYTSLRQQRGVSLGRPYRPILLGIVWPSVWVVPWWQQGPNIAGTDNEDDSTDETGEALEAMLVSIAEALPADQRARFYMLAQSDGLDSAEAKEFLVLCQPIFDYNDDELPSETLPDVDDLLASWDAIEAASKPQAGEFVPMDLDAPVAFGEPAPAAQPQPAGAVLRSPLSGIRLASVWQMKDRAGKVGADALAALLRSIQVEAAANGARTHLIGHSFGAKVMLSAICSPRHGELAKPVDSLLLLQPAINHYAFADTLPNANRPGGYRGALARVRQPILTTFTRQDGPLRTFFHLGLRRQEDIGEINIASDVAPSRFAALGGYGPANAPASRLQEIAAPGTPYTLDNNLEIIALRAHEQIEGHSDVSKPVTYWALLELVRSS